MKSEWKEAHVQKWEAIKNKDSLKSNLKIIST